MLNNQLSKLREKRENGEGGFTLIELLVVVVIIGILIAIAIPVYLNYQKGANDKSAQSDLRNAISTLEQCNSNNGTYPTAAFTGGSTTASASTAAGTCTLNLQSSSGTTFKYYPASSAGAAYSITDTNASGSGKIYCYSSVAGGGVTTISTDKTAYASSC